ncbi:MAG: trypsin-like peptidase domain-containing protein [Clostridia bacterium]|nr:trypsin-like peptidase domain-containing protein [Clostridia bacterium]
MNNGYGNNNSYNNGYNNNYSAPPEQNRYDPIVLRPAQSEPPKSDKRGIGAGVVALILVCSLFISTASGFAGGYLVSAFMQKSDIKENVINNFGGSNGGKTTVVYENLSSEASEVKEGTVESVAAAVENSVVEITTEVVSTSSFFGQFVTSGAGSGVIITADGYIVTNNHVIDGASNITVRLKNGNEYKAELIGTDADTDLAVIKVSAEETLPPAVFGNSDVLRVGQQVVAVGNPLGSLGGTVTTGIISALDREVTVEGKKMNLLQTDTAVNPGNSGGGLFNLKGELIGVVNAKSSGSDVEGLGFAIPAVTAAKTVSELIEYGYVKGRVDLGLVLIDISDSMTAMYYRVNTLGCYVSSSKYTDELKQGDRIIAINDTEVVYSDDILELKNDMSVGDTVTVTVVRNGKTLDVEFVCREKTPGESDINFET